MLADTQETLPATPELVWGLVAFVLVLGLVVLIVGLVIRASAGRGRSANVTSRLEGLEDRVTRLEEQDQPE